jgi:hypothetical protein
MGVLTSNFDNNIISSNFDINIFDVIDAPKINRGGVYCSKHANMLSLRDSYTNPSGSIQIKFFEIFGVTNWIHDTNLSKIGLWIESTKRIFWTQ